MLIGYLHQWFSTEENFVPQGHLAMPGAIFDRPDQGVGVTDTQ